MLSLTEAGIATSSPLGWQNGAETHIVRRGTTPSSVLQVTVAAGSAADAEVLTKACLSLTPQQGVDLVRELGADALLVLEDGVQMSTPGWIDLCE